MGIKISVLKILNIPCKISKSTAKRFLKRYLLEYEIGLNFSSTKPKNLKMFQSVKKALILKSVTIFRLISSETQVKKEHSFFTTVSFKYLSVIFIT